MKANHLFNGSRDLIQNFKGFFERGSNLNKSSKRLPVDTLPSLKNTTDMFTASFERRTSISFSLSATYTKVGVLNSSTALPKDVEGPSFNLTQLPQIMDKVKEELEELSNPEKNLSPDEMLKKLIIDRLTGKNDIDLTGIDQFEFSSVSSTKIDFTLDYSGFMKWNGSLYQTDFHLEFHLEQQEMINVSYSNYADHDLLKVDDRHIDTGRYLISFESASSLQIFDKFSNLATTIWGDPHVDLSDKEGRVNGEFSDLKKSSILTTLKLLDKTTVIIKAPDNGLIEEVHVVKGDKHVKGLGLGKLFKAGDGHSLEDFFKSTSKKSKVGVFGAVDKILKNFEELVSNSDVVIAGGDGNDWFDQEGNLVWGGNK